MFYTHKAGRLGFSKTGCIFSETRPAVTLRHLNYIDVDYCRMRLLGRMREGARPDNVSGSALHRFAETAVDQNEREQAPDQEYPAQDEKNEFSPFVFPFFHGSPPSASSS
jgi:hypothetical protein